MRKATRGWSKVSVIGVIALLVIGCALLMPGVPSERRCMGPKVMASISASGLAKVYNAYCFTSTDLRGISSEQATDITSFAVFLARYGGMNISELWFIKRDPRLENVNEWPPQVVDLSDLKHPVVEPAFVKARPKSFAVVVDLPDLKTLETRASAYPVVWTRGLGANGWKKDSPFVGEGGHVAYLDGHVVWYESTVDAHGVGVFKDYLTGQPTSDIRKAIGPGAKVLEDE